ncbi:hypothetical protein [Frigidibacter sp. ROC022]|uniref:hypothetical protein n=1 Tax=Frigidibacter sp. ROC022 TaxID=2971796 RepID=UPI00215A500E|nr:hypothetical protein [Frigidibacter sp. ROC022]MCR8724549.1 hypothetical protein [Frigidibacter sp. ROC022]
MSKTRDTPQIVPLANVETQDLTKESPDRSFKDVDPDRDRDVRPTTALNGLPTTDLAEATPDNHILKKIFNTKTEVGALGLLMTTLNGLGLKGALFRDFVLAMGAELEPKDAIEAMLVTQMGVTHASMMEASKKAWDAPDVTAREAYDRIMNRLARTFGMQMEQLRRYRSGSSQVVRVEHVTVNAGGQAIVGSVHSEGGGREKGR